LKICNLGEELVDKRKFQNAVEYFENAFNLIPNPKTDWEAGSWILAAIGDCYYAMNNYERAVTYLKHGELYPKGIDSGFIQLRIGQCYQELDKIKEAREYLLRAYLLGGEEIFEEEETSKYKLLIIDLINKQI